MSEHAQAARDVDKAKQAADEYRARSAAYTKHGGIVTYRDGSWSPVERGRRKGRRS